MSYFPLFNLIPKSNVKLESNLLSPFLKFGYCFYSKKQEFVIQIAKPFSSSEEKAKNAKNRHRETSILFGPLLKTTSEKREEQKKGVMKIGKDIVICETPESEKPDLDQEIVSRTHSGYVPNVLKETLLVEKYSELKNFPMTNLRHKEIFKMEKKSEVVENEIREQLQEPRYFPSVSKILNATISEKSKDNLEKWKKSMIEKLGDEGFAAYQAQLFKQGKDLHVNIAQLLSGKDPKQVEIMPENVGHWKSLTNVLPQIKNVLLIEQNITHPMLQYKGVVDCVAVYKKKLVVIDWKTSKKLKTSLFSIFDNPVQVVAYLGALNYDPLMKIEVDSAAVVIAYEDGTPANVHFLDRYLCMVYWKKWLIRLSKFRDSQSVIS